MMRPRKKGTARYRSLGLAWLLVSISVVAQERTSAAPASEETDAVITRAQKCLDRGGQQLEGQEFERAYETFRGCSEIIGSRYIEETMKDDTGMYLAVAHVEARRQKFPEAAKLARRAVESRLHNLKAKGGRPEN